MLKKHQKNNKNGQEYLTILGIHMLSTSINEVLTGITEKISHNEKFSIFTPNPEIVLASSKDLKLKKVVNSGDYLIPDGVGLKYASIFLYGNTLNIIPGRILFEKLIERAYKNSWRVFLLGGLGKESELSEQKIRDKYKNIIIGSHKGPKLNAEGRPITEVDKKIHYDVVKEINKFKPHLLFVAFGHPKQELWIAENLESLNVNGVMAVGGTLGYMSGLSKLPPDLFQKLGLEWLFRLFREPYRLIRIWNAVVVFSSRVFLSKFGVKHSNS